MRYDEELPVAASIIFDKLIQDRNAILELTTTDLPSHKERNPWLRVSGWPEFAKSFVPEGTSFATIESILKPSGPDNYASKKLNDQLLHYMENLRCVSGKIEVRFRRLVMGYDESGKVPARGLRVHSVRATTTKYCHFIGFLLNALIRERQLPATSGSLKLFDELTPKQAEQCDALISSMAKQTDESKVDLIPLHHFLLSLWTNDHDEIAVHVHAQSKSFVLRFILLTSLQKSFSDTEGYGFQNVSTVTGRCSILFYWIRATVLMEIGRSLWDDSSKDFDLSKQYVPITHQDFVLYYESHQFSCFFPLLLLLITDDWITFCVLCKTTRVGRRIP